MPKSELRIYSGTSEACTFCKKPFSVGQVIIVAGNGELTFCDSDRPDGCVHRYLVSGVYRRMLICDPYIYRERILGPGDRTAQERRWERNRNLLLVAIVVVLVILSALWR